MLTAKRQFTGTMKSDLDRISFFNSFYFNNPILAGNCQAKQNQNLVNPIHDFASEYCSNSNLITTTEWELIFENLESNCFCTPNDLEDDPSCLTSLCAYPVGPNEQHQDRE